MTETEWLKDTDLARLLEELCRDEALKPSHRRLRLFVAAFWRWWARGLRGAARRDALAVVNLAEQWGETGKRPPAVKDDYRGNIVGHSAKTAALGTIKVVREWGPGGGPVRKKLAGLFYCLFANPFRPVAFDPAWLAWNDRTVSRLAQQIYARRAFGRLPVLADALEDAGCADRGLLDHLRGPGPHARGCWALDLLLARE
jgi:hypothetical protein